DEVEVTNNSIFVCFEDYGLYEVYLTGRNYCGSDTAYRSFLMQADTTIKVYADTTIFAGDTAFVWVENGNEHQWTSNTTGLNCVTCTSTFGIFTDDSEVYIQMIDQYGCPVLDTVNIGIYEDFGIYVPTAFTPGKNDGLNDIFEVKSYG